MKGYNQEHLEAVADRNAELYKKGRNEFYARMFLNGWNDAEIKMMIKHLERKSK